MPNAKSLVPKQTSPGLSIRISPGAGIPEPVSGRFGYAIQGLSVICFLSSWMTDIPTDAARGPVAGDVDWINALHLEYMKIDPSVNEMLFSILGNDFPPHHDRRAGRQKRTVYRAGIAGVNLTNRPG